MVSSDRMALLRSMEGQTLHISNLNALFSSWPSEINPHLEKIRLEVTDKLEALFPNDPRVPKLKHADFGFFGSLWWPQAQYSQLRTVTFLAIWLFVWDDEIDAEGGPLAADGTKADEYREQTIDYVKHCLGIETMSSSQWPSNVIIRSFEPIGEDICKAYDEEQKRVLLKEMIFFMQMSDREQKTRLGPQAPSVEDYAFCRMGTSAVGVTCAVNELASRISLPAKLRCDPDMERLWDLTNVIVWVVNDILSVKKELAQDTVDSLIPLLYLEHGNLQTAIECAEDRLNTSIQEFERVSRQLLVRYYADIETRVGLEEFVKACQQNCTGNLRWSLMTGRYGICKESLQGGLSIKL